MVRAAVAVHSRLPFSESLIALHTEPFLFF